MTTAGLTSGTAGYGVIVKELGHLKDYSVIPGMTATVEICGSFLYSHKNGGF